MVASVFMPPANDLSQAKSPPRREVNQSESSPET